MKLCHSQNEAKRGCSRQTIASWRLSITNHRCCSELPASISRSSWDDCHCLGCRALSRGSATHAVRALDCRRFSGDGNCVTRNCHGWEASTQLASSGQPLLLGKRGFCGFTWLPQCSAQPLRHGCDGRSSANAGCLRIGCAALSELQLRKGSHDVSLSVDWTVQWLESLADGVYSVPGLLIRAGNGSQARFVGHRPGTDVRWQVDPHVWFQADYGVFYAGKFLKETQPGHNLLAVVGPGYKF
jgi:hypothetical protein